MVTMSKTGGQHRAGSGAPALKRVANASHIAAADALRVDSRGVVVSTATTGDLLGALPSSFLKKFDDGG